MSDRVLGAVTEGDCVLRIRGGREAWLGSGPALVSGAEVRDLALQHVEGPLCGLETFPQFLPPEFQKSHPFRGAGIAAEQRGEATQVVDAQPGVTQATDHADPVDVVAGVPAVTSVPGDWPHQALTFVVPQGVQAEASALNGLGGRKGFHVPMVADRWPGAAQETDDDVIPADHLTWSALQ